MKTSRGRWGVVALTSLFLFTGHSWSADSGKKTELSKAQQTLLDEQVIPACLQKDPLTILQSLSPIVAKLDDSRLELVDRYLEAQGLATSDELLANARLVLVEQNLTAALPKPESRELILTLKGLIARIEKELVEAGKHSALATDQNPQKSLKEYEALFWELHVLDNRLLSVARITTYASQLSAVANKLPKKSLSEAQQQILATDMASYERQVLQLRQRLATREFDYRVARLEAAYQTLKSSQDLKERFRAAFVIDLDGERLAQQLKISGLTQATKPKDAPKRSEESAATDTASDELDPLVGRSESQKILLADKVNDYLTNGRQEAGEDLLTKSRLLFTGLHWWTRGRYGAGSDGNGLLKNKLALASPQAMFGLYMPTQTPTPTDPTSSGQQIPQVDRRHHYLWQFETRSIQTSFDSTTLNKSTSIGSTARVTHRFF
jgi:hypothetical protein